MTTGDVASARVTSLEKACMSAVDWNVVSNRKKNKSSQFGTLSDKGANKNRKISKNR